MLRYSILLGSAPEDFRQKKIEEMFDFLDSKKSAGDSIVTFANGISEIMLEMVMDNSVKQLTENSKQTTGLNVRHCERSEAISKSNGDCFVANAPRNNVADSNAPRNDVKISHSELDSESNKEMLKQVQHDSLLLYICTLQPVGDDEKSFWLGGEEIRKDVIRHYQKLGEECGIDMQVVMDFDSEMVSEEELGWEDVVSINSTTAQKVRHCEWSEAISESVGGSL